MKNMYNPRSMCHSFRYPYYIVWFLSSLLLSVSFADIFVAVNTPTEDVVAATTTAVTSRMSDWEFCGCCTFTDAAWIGGKDPDGVSSASDMWVMNEAFAKGIYDDDVYIQPHKERNTVEVHWTSIDPESSYCYDSYNVTEDGTSVIAKLAAIEIGHPALFNRGEFGIGTDIRGHMAIQSGDTVCMQGSALLDVNVNNLGTSDSVTVGGCKLSFRTNEGSCTDLVQ